MAAVKGVNATLIATGGESKILQGMVDSKIKCFVDTYEAAALATSSTIAMGPTLPTGARVISYQLAFDALSTVSLSLGDSNSAVRYLASVDTANTAGIKNDILIDGLNYIIGTASGDNQILVSTTGVSAATGTIKLAVFYVID
jgi:hypothetical protein